VRQAEQHADTLAYASHADSAHAWARIRQVKTDLLSARNGATRMTVLLFMSLRLDTFSVDCGGSSTRKPGRAVTVDVAPVFSRRATAPWALQALITGTSAVALTAVGLALVLDNSHSPLQGIPQATGLGISGRTSEMLCFRSRCHIEVARCRRRQSVSPPVRHVAAARANSNVASRSSTP
jgi:hypothetical protein